MLRRSFLILTAALLFITGSAYAAPNTSKIGQVMLITPPDAHTLGFVSRWFTDLTVPSTNKLGEAVLLDDLIVTLERPDNLVSAVSVRDGSLMWRRVVDERVALLFTPARIGKKILVNSENRMNVLSAQTGETLALSDLETPVNTAPAIVDNYAVFGGDNGLIFAHNIATSYSAWRARLPMGIMVRPVSQDNVVFLADSAGNYAMYSGDGHPLWQGRAHAKISAEPVMTQNDVFVASEDQSLYALDRKKNGRDRWIYRAEAPLQRSPVALGASIYLPLPSGELVSIDLLNGSELWRIKRDAHPFALLDQKLLLYTPKSILVVDNQTGKTVTELPTVPLKTILRGPDNSLILVSLQGQLQRLDPR